MSPKIINAIVILVLVVLSLGIFANGMTKPLGRDEQMYCTGGVLMAQGKMIYRDFSYVAQLPYHPLLYAVLFRILNTNHYLLVGRMVSVICDVLVMLCIVGIYRRIFGKYADCGLLLGVASAILYVFNPLVDYANGYAWNHDVVILCVMLSFFILISTDFKQKSRYWRIAFIGGLLTFATCMRITTALIQLLFFAALLSQLAESVKHRIKNVLPFLIATFIVLIWPVWVIASSGQAFFLNLFWIPRLYGKWLHEVGIVYNKPGLTLNALKTPGYLVLIAMAIYLCCVMIWQRRKLVKIDGRILLFTALLVLAFFIIALIPPTMWIQYLAMPVPFLIISFAHPLLYLRQLADKVKDNKQFKIAGVVIAICVVVVVLSYPIFLYRTVIVLVPEGWTPIQVHEISQDIAEKTQEPKKILTLAPLFALEGGCDIYTELSCGSIVYRIGDRLSAWNRETTHTVGPKSLAKLLEKELPSAVIVNIEAERMKFLEEDLVKTAVKPDWERKVYEYGPVVYFRR
ncbi:MAG: glycosyltransferase family protein [Planctomycetota bacterium]|jgi:4-amino-4-deoxy-L-arabinose transferase-like glycosyltransferase